MTGRRGTFLLAVYANIPAPIEDEFNRWYNQQHIPERLALPGFLSAARYETIPFPGFAGGRSVESLEGNPKYLALYELEDARVLESPAYLAVRQRNETDPWDQRLLSHLQVTIRAVYEQLLACGEPGDTHGPVFLSVHFDVPPDLDDEFNAWYNQDHLPNLSTVPGVQGARRYRRLSGNGPQYVAVYECDNDQVTTTDAWAKAANTEWTKKMRLHNLKPLVTMGRRIF
jgi:hypothetical protein